MQRSQKARLPWLVTAFLCAGCQIDSSGAPLTPETPELRYFTLAAIPPSSIDVRVGVGTYRDGHVIVGGDVYQATAAVTNSSRPAETDWRDRQLRAAP